MIRPDDLAAALDALPDDAADSERDLYAALREEDRRPAALLAEVRSLALEYRENRIAWAKVGEALMQLATEYPELRPWGQGITPQQPDGALDTVQRIAEKLRRQGSREGT